jgi:hypothetical protein
MVGDLIGASVTMQVFRGEHALDLTLVPDELEV